MVAFSPAAPHAHSHAHAHAARAADRAGTAVERALAVAFRLNLGFLHATVEWHTNADLAHGCAEGAVMPLDAALTCNPPAPPAESRKPHPSHPSPPEAPHA